MSRRKMCTIEARDERHRPGVIRRAAVVLAAAAAIGPFAVPGAAGAAHFTPFLARFGSSSFVTPTSEVGSTVPGNGDVNPYGLAVVAQSSGRLVAGDALVSNFNNSSNQQGTGTTIVEISPSGAQSVFAQIDPGNLPGACPGGVGLTTALSILPGGWVVVGSLPAPGGLPANAQPGCLLVLNNRGAVVETWSGSEIDGPWDMTSVAFGNQAFVFISNVLNGTVAGAGVSDPNTMVGNTVFGGTVTRLRVVLSPSAPPALVSWTTIATGLGEHTDPAALVVGPTGLGLSALDVLYVADTVGNRIVAIPGALERTSAVTSPITVTADGALSSPLGLAMAPNGDILTVNGGNSLIVETGPFGVQVDSLNLGNPAMPRSALGAGTLFGLAIPAGSSEVLFVDDLNNFLDHLG